MSEPARKDHAVEQGLEILFGRTTAIRADRCTACGKAATEFKDEISRKEYTLSGLCQTCQDEVFAEPKCSALSIPHLPEVGESVPVSRCRLDEGHEGDHEPVFDHDAAYWPE